MNTFVIYAESSISSDDINSRVLDRSNPYSHYNPDDPRASKECRGLLFHGLEDDPQHQAEIQRFRRRIRNLPWHQFEDDGFIEEEEE